MITTLPSTTPAFGTLARREIRRYLGHKLFWFGGGLSILLGVLDLSRGFARSPESSTMYAIAPAALLGVLGLVIMVGLTRGSDRAAEAAGAVSVPERVRTLALASTVVVPGSVALLCWIGAAVGYVAHPPAAWTIPAGLVDDGFVLAAMFALGVIPAVGGPLLGLVLARWLPFRGVAPVAVVLLVLITIALQGILPATRSWRVVWPWTYFYGPIQITGDTERWFVLTGSPWFYLAYLLVLCAIGVLVAVYHDPESNRPVLRKVIIAGLVVAAVLVVLTATGGLPETTPNPLAPGTR